MKKIHYIIGFLLIAILIGGTTYAINKHKNSPQLPYVNGYMQQHNDTPAVFERHFKKEAFCKISPQSKVLFSMLDYMQFDAGYRPNNDRLFLEQCLQHVYLKIFIENEKGSYSLTTSRSHNTYPGCKEEVEQLEGIMWGPRTLPDIYLIPGTFISEPIVVDKNYFMLVQSLHPDDTYPTLTHHIFLNASQIFVSNNKIPKGILFLVLLF